MNLKEFFTLLNIFILLLVFGTFLSFIYIYIQSIFIEKELVRIFFEMNKNTIEKKFEFLILTNLNNTNNILSEDFNKKIKLSGTVKEDIEALRSAVESIYLQFKEDKLYEIEDCNQKHSTDIEESCEFRLISSFPLNLAKLSVSMSLIDQLYEIISRRSKRIDEQIVKTLILAQIMNYHGLYWLNVFSLNITENCTKELPKLYEIEQKKILYSCLNNLLSRIEKRADALINEIKPTELNIPDCAQYLPLIEAKSLEEYLSSEYHNVKNPYLKLFYSITIKSLNQCINWIFKNLRNYNLLCYKPESFSLVTKSINSATSTSGALFFCIMNTITKEISHQYD